MEIVILPGEYPVVVSLALENVDTLATPELVPSGSTPNCIVARLTIYAVPALPTTDEVVPASA